MTLRGLGFSLFRSSLGSKRFTTPTFPAHVFRGFRVWGFGVFRVFRVLGVFRGFRN